MAFPRPPGGLFPLTTRPTGNNAGGQYPLPAALVDAIRSLAPTAYWKLDEASGNLADAMSGGYTATVTGSPTYGTAAPSPIGRGVTWSGTGQYAVASASVPTPTTGITVISAFRHTSGAGTTRRMMARLAASQFSWVLHVDAVNNFPQFIVYQSGGAAHAAAGSGVMNDGAWHLAVAGFDGTTIWFSVDGVITGTSTSLTGTWHTATTAAPAIAASSGASSLWDGSLAHCAIVNRDIGQAAGRWLGSIAKGG